MDRVLKLLDQSFLAAIVGICGYATSELSKIQNSVNQLNTQIAVVIERINYHDKELQSQRTEIERIIKTRGR